MGVPFLGGLPFIFELALLKSSFETAKIRTLSLPKGLFLDCFLTLESLRQAQGPGQRFFSTEHFELGQSESFFLRSTCPFSKFFMS
jgi:hypothetical protein